MPKPLRYTGDWPPPEILREYPNWICAWDEEGEEDQDETTLKPEDEQSMITAATIHTASDVVLADGRSFAAIISLASGAPESFDYHDGSTWVRCRQDYKTKRWVPFDQNWLPPERRMPTVDFADSRTFPLRLSTRLPHAETGEPVRLEIRPDGSAAEWR